MTGAVPSAQWLDGCVALDVKGFIKTGFDLSQDDLAAAHWPLTTAPHLLETSLPGIFAVGDVRAGNIKRVASAVGERSIAVGSASPWRLTSLKRPLFRVRSAVGRRVPCRSPDCWRPMKSF